MRRKTCWARRSTLRPNHATVRMDWRYCSFLGMSLPCRSFMCFRSNLRPMDTSMCGHREAKDLLWLRFVMTAQERRVVSKSGQLHVLDAYKFAVIEKFCSRWQILAPAGTVARQMVNAEEVRLGEHDVPGFAHKIEIVQLTSLGGH